MATLADFQADFVGTTPAGFADMPAYLAVLERIANSALPMPPPQLCAIDGIASPDNDAMTQGDFDVLSDWLTKGAPSGAAYF